MNIEGINQTKTINVYVYNTTMYVYALYLYTGKWKCESAMKKLAGYQINRSSDL